MLTLTFFPQHQKNKAHQRYKKYLAYRIHLDRNLKSDSKKNRETHRQVHHKISQFENFQTEG